MKKLLLAVVALALLLLSSCQQMAGPQGDEAQEAQAIEQADQKSAQMLDLLVAARATGDSTELESFLNDEDPDGQLRALLEAHWVFRKPLQSKEVYYLPEFGTDAYLDKDVLVCKGSGGATSNLMDLILVNGYSHAGILNKDFAPPLDDPYLLPREREQQACVLSADVDYLQNYFQEGDHSLTYETYAGWKAGNDVVTVLRWNGGAFPSGMYGEIHALFDDIYAKPVNQGGTVYAFLGYLGTPYKAFEPIPRTDNHYWYCSKVAWRVFAGPEYQGPDIERADFYFTNGKWTVFKNSLLYKLYVLCLIKCGYPFWLVPGQAQRKIQDVLARLVTPDELRASTLFGKVATYGDASLDKCWDAFGGW